MALNLEQHPCFNDAARHKFGRVHLPVAPRCNIKCRFCNRKFDCVNESRPGVSSGILTPRQAMAYLDEVMKRKGNISVVGIAGPGDPFANPDESMETLRLVRKKYPDMLLCVATNGLNVGPYLDELKELDVSHVTITVNAVDPEVGEKIYSWVRSGKHVYHVKSGFKMLMEKQFAAVKGLKERGITTKINTIIIPGINDRHVEAVSQKMAELGADLQNCVAYYPNEGSDFENMAEPSPAMMKTVRETAQKYMPLMHHCTRCRADAVGLLGETPDMGLMKTLQACEQMTDFEESSDKPSPDVNRPHVAVATLEGVLVNQHLGQAQRLAIYGKKDGSIHLLETRETPVEGTGANRWAAMAQILSDCGTLLVSGIGETPKMLLSEYGLQIFEVEGLIDEALDAFFSGKGLAHMKKHDIGPCTGGRGKNVVGCC
jgi:nitrogen fixation protein NifB